uniref:Elongation factor-like 1 n=1 Tax=Oryza rufipogon TaxID=4529 RepID=A0A0E0NG55_ORYRU
MAAAAAEGRGPRRVRNTCILAHVDHGKTSLADHLIAAYGSERRVSERMAGSARVMDHLEEEQRRAITMKSASIALRRGGEDGGGHRVHLIDSPGHIDFCSEVSAAARLADSALVLVDAAEGVRVQTHAALRQAFVERLRPCLVLNKVDRLVAELRLTPAEAHARLRRIVSEVNSIYSALRSRSYFSTLDAACALSQELPDNGDAADEEEDAFQPQNGNVVFACAREGWGFRLVTLAKLLAPKLRADPAELLKGLWGQKYFDERSRTVVGKEAMAAATANPNPKPMFVKYVLEPLWGQYHKMKRKLRLAEAVFDMVVECTPNPIAAQATRVARLMPAAKTEQLTAAAPCPAAVAAEVEKVRRCVATCNASTSAPVVVFVSKMFAVPFRFLPSRGVNGEPLNHRGSSSSAESGECFLAFARVFSGVLRAGHKVFVLSPMYDPLRGGDDAMQQKHLQEVELQHLYQMMGPDLEIVSAVRAGDVLAIEGLGHHVLKNATLSSTKNCQPFSGMMFQVSPMLKVAIEPSNPSDLGALVKGLKLLNQADPFIEYTVSERGEHVLAAAGEIHLEHCIKNLQERFARVQLEVSKPLVSFKDTIQGEGAGIMESLKASHEFVERTTPNGRFTVRVKVFRLPNAVTKVIEDSKELLAQVIEGDSGNSNGVLDSRFSQDGGDSASTLRQLLINAIDSDLEALSAQLDDEKTESYGKMLIGYLQRIWALGPLQVGPNLLLSPDATSSDGVVTSQDGREGILVRGTCHVSERLGLVNSSDAKTTIGIDGSQSAVDGLDPETVKNSIASGFQLATNAGPLCGEPTWGLAFLVKPYILPDSADASNNQSDHYSTFSGQIITAVREACQAAILESKPRLVEPMYFCELTTPTEQLGSMYAVLGNCRARVLKEEMQEGTSLFTVHAYLSVAESSEFSKKLRNATAGAASALLAFSHWETVPQDPFFVPKTREEIEEFGDGSNIGPNLATKLMNSVRRRKGLHVEEKIVEYGTKQRTLAKKV